MRTPQRKPHFFKPVLHGSQDGVLIPKSFSKYLEGQRLDHATLRRGHRSWLVKINGTKKLEDGWEKFSVDNKIEVGDFLVFRHEGEMVFHVLVFGPSACLKELVPPPSDEDSKLPAKPKDEEISPPEQSVQHRELNRSNNFLNGKGKGGPHFHSTVKDYSIEKSTMYIPLQFARENRFIERQCSEMFLIDEKQRSWAVGLRYDRYHVCIGRGWSKLCFENDLKAGDMIKFELIENRNKPIMNVHKDESIAKPEQPIKALVEDHHSFESTLKQYSLRRSNVEEMKELQIAEGKSIAKPKQPVKALVEDHHSFASTLKQYSLRRSTLWLPKEFTRRNSLSNGEMIIRDENGRSWPVQLRDIGSKVYIGHGWTDFRIANELKEGDAFKFELIRKGKKPVANFYIKCDENHR